MLPNSCKRTFICTNDIPPDIEWFAFQVLRIVCVYHIVNWKGRLHHLSSHNGHCSPCVASQLEKYVILGSSTSCSACAAHALWPCGNAALLSSPLIAWKQLPLLPLPQALPPVPSYRAMRRYPPPQLFRKGGAHVLALLKINPCIFRGLVPTICPNKFQKQLVMFV